MIQDNLTFLEHPKLSGEIALIGLPLDLGKDNIGTQNGPATLREQGIVEALEDSGLTVFDRGDISCPDKTMVSMGDKQIKYLEPIVAVAEELAQRVANEIKSGRKVVLMGGDNTASIGSLSGAGAALNGDLGIIWIDAHGDINTHETTLSGNVHGMPVAAVLGLGHPKLTNIYKSGPKIKPENVVYVGLKDLDQAEIDTLRRYHISVTTMLDIAASGLQPAFVAISALSQKVKHVWVCLDIDSMDEDCAPGTPMATKGGLTYRESVMLAKYIGKVCPVVGIDVTELAPALDKDNRTARLAIELIVNYLGTETSWYTKYMADEAKKQTLR